MPVGGNVRRKYHPLNDYAVVFHGKTAKYEVSMRYGEIMKAVLAMDAKLYNAWSRYASNMLRPVTNNEIVAGTIKGYAFRSL